MINGWLIYNREDEEKNKSFINWFLQEASDLNINLEFKLKENFIWGIKESKHFIKYNSKEINPPDFAIVRNIDPLFTKQFEYLGDIKTFNSSFVAEICNNKAKTHQYLAQYKIPMLDTIFLNTKDFNKDIIDDKFPKIVKAVSGRGGSQVYKVTSVNDLYELICTLPNEDIIIQEIGEVPGKDLRVFVIGDRIIGAVLRESKVDFRANYSLGGTSRLYKLSQDEIKAINKVLDLFDFGMVGIDFLFNKKGELILNEIEDVVGSRTLSQNSDINIVREYLEFIIKCF